MTMFDRPIYQRQQYCIRFYYCGCYLCLMLLLMLCKFKNLKIAVESYVWRAFSGLKIEQSLSYFSSPLFSFTVQIIEEG